MARNKFDVDEELEEEFKLSHLSKLVKYAKPYKKQILITVIVTIISSFLYLIWPYLFRIVIDTAIPNNDYNLIVKIAIIFVVAMVASSIFGHFKIKYMSIVGDNIMRDLRRDIFVHLQKLSFTYYDDRPHGKILVRVVNYVNSLNNLVGSDFVTLVAESFSLVITLGFMLLLSPKLTGVMLLTMPFVVLAIWVIKNKQAIYWRVNSTKTSNLNAYLHESIAGMKITQSFAREEESLNIYNDITEPVTKSWMDAIRIMLLMLPVTETLTTITTIIVLLVAIQDVISGTLLIGTLLAFIAYLNSFWTPINNIVNIFNSLVQNMAYLERIFETLDEPITVHDKEGAVDIGAIKGDVEFKHVDFSYDVGEPILTDINFKVNAGESIALVGPTGAGKTTIVNMISRFYDIDSGEILIDGTNIYDVTLKSLREQMGIMLQDSFIFSGTIYDNIRYGKLDATEEEIIEAAKAVRAHEFIMQMEDGYDTEVNERGSRLSIGQRQLISFARTLLANPRILVLDEATSSIDTETEILVQQALDTLLQGRTSFIIAHRLSTIKNCDCIFYIDNKNIAERGTHDELIAQDGLYASLCRAQYSFLN